MFTCFVRDLGEQTLTSGQFALEFESHFRYKYVYVRYWKEDVLVKVFINRYGLQNSSLNGEMGAVSRLLSAISSDPQLIAVSGCSADFVEVLDESKFSKHDVISPFRFDSLCLETLMHKLSYSIFERIDFFSVLRGLVAALGGSLPMSWTLGTPELSKVCIGLILCMYIVDL